MDGTILIPNRAFDELYEKGKHSEWKLKEVRNDRDKRERESLNFKPEICKHS